MSHPAKLTATEQAQAIGRWGAPASFRCCACGNESSTTTPGEVATSIGLVMATCEPCDRQLRLSPAFRSQTRGHINEAAMRALWQRVADLVGVTGAALIEAMPTLGSTPAVTAFRTADVRLQLPPESIETAVAHVLGVGVPQ